MADSLSENITEITRFLEGKDFFIPDSGLTFSSFNQQLRQEAQNVFRLDHRSVTAQAMPTSQWDAIFLQFDKVGKGRNLSVEFCFSIDYKTNSIDFSNVSCALPGISRSYARGQETNWQSKFPSLSVIESDLQKSIRRLPRQMKPLSTVQRRKMR